MPSARSHRDMPSRSPLSFSSGVYEPRRIVRESEKGLGLAGTTVRNDSRGRTGSAGRDLVEFNRKRVSQENRYFGFWFEENTESDWETQLQQ